MQVFYVNVGGGEPTMRARFLRAARVRRRPPRRGEVLDQRQADHARRARAARRAATTSTSRSRSTARRRGQRRGARPGSYDTALAGDGRSRDAGFGESKCRVVVTRHNVGQLDDFEALADAYGAQLRLTRLRPSGRGADNWDELHPTAAAAARALPVAGREHGETVLTGDTFFHLSALGEPLPGLNLCGAGRVVCLVDPIGDVYACPFAIHEQFRAGSVRDGGFAAVWRDSELFAELRGPAAAGACHRAAPRTPAAAAAWRRSSSPGCRSTGPTPSACSATARRRCGSRAGATLPRPAPDHSRPPALVPSPRPPGV